MWAKCKLIYSIMLPNNLSLEDDEANCHTLYTLLIILIVNWCVDTYLNIFVAK